MDLPPASGRPPTPSAGPAGPGDGTKLRWIRAQVGRALDQFLRQQRRSVLMAANELRPGLDAIAQLLAAGKRLRPAFCYWGWRAAGGRSCTEIITAAAALELLHAGALVHDDVIDSSDTRRGQPSLHRRFAAQHTAAGWHGSAASFGTGAAILMGDLLLCWADDMLRDSGLPAGALRRGHRVLAAMRTEVLAGQYLDLLEPAGGAGSVESALRVAVLKTAKYTVERPLHLGAVLAGAGDDVVAALSQYGLPVGTAFQLRDDILGVFGDPAQTGKPAGDDVREGKRTVLVALAFAAATPAQAAVLAGRLGDPGLDSGGVSEAQDIIRATGALRECEAMIERHTSAGLAALAGAPLRPEAKAALAALAAAATTRTR